MSDVILFLGFWLFVGVVAVVWHFVIRGGTRKFHQVNPETDDPDGELYMYSESCHVEITSQSPYLALPLRTQVEVEALRQGKVRHDYKDRLGTNCTIWYKK